MKPTIGFVGQGFIGSAYSDDFERRGYKVIRYSLDKFVENKEKIAECDITFIAVPTPSTPDGFDYSIVENVLQLIGKEKIAVIKSTVLPGTTEKLQEKYPDIYLFHSPEFLTEKTAIYDAANPARNIVGYTEKSFSKSQNVMNVLPPAPFESIVPVKEAELVKYAGNCWFYFKIVFMNTVYDLSQKLGIDYESVINMMAADKRIGRSHLDVVHQGGRGAGGRCLLPDTKIITEKGIKNICDIEIGERVLTHTGVFKKVINTSKREINELINVIKCQGTQPFYVTNEHPVFSALSNRKYCGVKKRKLTNGNKDKIKLDFNLSESLSIGDYICFPKFVQKSVSFKIDGLELKSEQDKLDFMRLAGYYIAEGCNDRKRVSFGFNINEVEYHKDVTGIIKRLFDYDACINKDVKRHQYNIRINSVKMSKMFRDLFDRLSQNIHIPNEWLLFEDKYLKELLRGYFRGDGSFSKNVFTSATISFKLDEQLRFLLYRFGIVYNSHHKNEKVDKNGLCHKKSYYICVSSIDETQKIADITGYDFVKDVKLIRHTAFVKDNYLLRSIREIEKIKYTGLVYNLEVEGDNSYVGLDGVWHNCFVKDMAAYAEMYEEYVGEDMRGNDLLTIIQQKNIELLRSSGKDLDLVNGVYGEKI